MLFQKLAVLTKQSPLVLLSLAREGDKFRLVITPKHAGKIDEDDKVEPHEAALVTPLSIVGTAAELDEGLTAELDRYLGARQALVSTVADYEQEMVAAKLAIKGQTAVSMKKRGATPSLPAKVEPPEEAPEDAEPKSPAAAALEKI